MDSAFSFFAAGPCRVGERARGLTAEPVDEELAAEEPAADI